MKLSTEEENALLVRYNALLRREVRLFQKNHPSADTEDLLQEARLAFLRHIRRIDSEKDIFLCKRQIFHALYTHARIMALVYIPHHAFKSEVGSFKRGYVDFDNLPDHSGDDMLLAIAFEEYLDSLS